MANPVQQNPGEWEPMNDDGFVYKQKKRRLDPTAYVSEPDPAVDPAVELKEKRRRKRKALLQLKDKYHQEIGLWEHLSNTIKAIENSNPKAKEGLAERLNYAPTQFDSGFSPSASLFSEVLLQVEAQEAIICDFSQLCEVAELLCSINEEKAKQKFVDLPIWKSPIELMASFNED